MADNVHLYGFRPYAVRSGAKLVPPVRMSVASGQNDVSAAGSVNINAGDPLLYVSTGGVIVAPTTTIVSWVCAGVAQYWSAGDGVMKIGKHYPNQTTWGTVESRRGYVLCWPASAYTWEVDCDDKVTATTKAAYEALVHENTEFVVPGNTTNSSADPMLDISLHANTATLGCRIVGISGSVHNRDFSGSYVKLLVQFNEIGEAASAASASIVAGI